MSFDSLPRHCKRSADVIFVFSLISFGVGEIGLHHVFAI